MNKVAKAYLQLMRPANLPTAAADIFAGAALAGILTVPFPLVQCSCLVFSSMFLYAGGVVLNDVFDMEIDIKERPERPIPSGVIPLKSAAFFGSTLLVLGLCLAFMVHLLSGCIAVGLTMAIVLYDGYSKKNAFLGPLNMGVCRGLNLILGMSVLGMLQSWWYAFIPLIYIVAITLISRGEVHGNNKSHIIWAGITYAAVILAVVSIVMKETSNFWQMLPFLLLFTVLVYTPLIKAYQENSPERIKKAVVAGVLSIIVLDATLAVGFSTWWYGILVLLLLPLSILLSKLFAVT